MYPFMYPLVDGGSAFWHARAPARIVSLRELSPFKERTPYQLSNLIKKISLRMTPKGDCYKTPHLVLRQYNQIRPHHALGMRPPVPETLLEKTKISGTEKWG